MPLKTTYSLTVPVGGATSYKLWPVLTCSNGYREMYRRFQRDFFSWIWRGLHGKIFPWKNLSWEEKISVGAQDFLILFKTKNNEKIKYEKVFSTESKDQH